MKCDELVSGGKIQVNIRKHILHTSMHHATGGKKKFASELYMHVLVYESANGAYIRMLQIICKFAKNVP